MLRFVISTSLRRIASLIHNTWFLLSGFLLFSTHITLILQAPTLLLILRLPGTDSEVSEAHRVLIPESFQLYLFEFELWTLSLLHTTKITLSDTR